MAHFELAEDCLMKDWLMTMVPVGAIIGAFALVKLFRGGGSSDGDSDSGSWSSRDSSNNSSDSGSSDSSGDSGGDGGGGGD
jgi:hypothetical protein